MSIYKTGKQIVEDRASQYITCGGIDNTSFSNKWDYKLPWYFDPKITKVLFEDIGFNTENVKLTIFHTKLECLFLASLFSIV
jgi:hypothetical protein